MTDPERRPAATRIWAAGIGACLLFAFYTASVYRTGLHYGGVDVEFVWFWVHGRQDTLWVAYIHPPLYAVFMNAVATLQDRTGLHTNDIVLLTTAGVQLALIVLAAALRPRIGRAGSLYAAALIALTPSAMRPLEQYPAAALLGALAIVAFVRLGDSPRPRAAIAAAAVAGLAAVEISLLLWFPLGAAAVVLAVERPAARRPLGAAAAIVLAAFFASTFLGLWDVLADTRGDVSQMRGWSFGWTNPAMIWGTGAAGAWALLRGPRSSLLAPTLAAGAAFTGVVVLLQQMAYADGAGYPDSFRYFSLIDPVLALAAGAALHALWTSAHTRRARILVAAAALALLGSQAERYVDGQAWIWRDDASFARFATPWKAPEGLRPAAPDPEDSVDISGFDDARKDCLRAHCSTWIKDLRVHPRGLLHGDPGPLDALRGCIEASCPK